ncbi:MAG: outer membrane beta-barrel protein [Pseudobdellovibrionaceae bacterium]
MKSSLALPCFLTTLLVLFFAQAQAQSRSYLSEMTSSTPQKHYLLADADMDDSYDPFSDYSEFDEDSDEEADINFFRNGRFFTVGFALGMRSFTGELNQLYSSAPTYGLFLSYFFDLRLALELGFQTGDHDFQISTTNESLGGNVSLTFIHMNLKYYLNTQNVTRGLADLNPYVLGGFSQIYRTYTIEGGDVASREATVGVNGGLGIEIPILRRKAFVGAQATYRYVNFKDENTAIVNSTTGTNYGVKPRGDTFDLVGILGMSF